MITIIFKLGRNIKKYFRKHIVFVISIIVIIVGGSLLIFNRMSILFSITGNISQVDTIRNERFWKNQFALIEIPVTINGIENSAIFDTGVGTTTLNESSASRYNVIIFPINFIKINNHSYHKIGIIPALKINNLQFKNVLVVLIDFKNTVLKCMSSDLILGMNIIRKTIWKFDYRIHKFSTLSKKDPDSSHYTNFINYTHEFFPQTHIKIETKEFSVLIDYGCGGCDVILYSYHKKEDTSKIAQQKNYISGAAEDVFGKFKMEGNEAKQDIIINKDTLKNMHVSSVHNTSGSTNWNLLGNRIFENYDVVTIDPFHQQIKLFKKTNEIVASNDFYDHGFSIGREKNNVVVNSIKTNSPIYKSGLKFGDTIVKINGIDVLKDLDDCSFITWGHEIFHFDTLKITIKRNNQYIDFEAKRSIYK